MDRSFAHPDSPDGHSTRKLLGCKVNRTHQNVHLMIEKARALVAEQGDLLKERQQLRLDLRRIREISRKYRTP